MIIEICGPPCVGKTTLAHALTVQLLDHGFAVELASSYRPSERTGADAPARGRLSDPLRRLIRPARELLSSAQELRGESREAITARKLMRLLPPRNVLWSIRLRQYIWRFSHVWYKADQEDQIVIFDQAFIQVVCSLVLLTATPDERRIVQALNLVPKPDLLVRLDAPREVLTQRLIEREHRQSRIDWLLEFDRKTNLRSIDVLHHLRELLLRQGVSSIDVDCTDTPARAEAVQRIEHAIVQRTAAKARAA